MRASIYEVIDASDRVALGSGEGGIPRKAVPPIGDGLRAEDIVGGQPLGGGRGLV